MNYCEALGLNLRRIREQQNLTVVQMAEKIGISSSYLYRLEKGKGNPRLSKVSMMIRAVSEFGISQNEFLRAAGDSMRLHGANL